MFLWEENKVPTLGNLGVYLGKSWEPRLNGREFVYVDIPLREKRDGLRSMSMAQSRRAVKHHRKSNEMKNIIFNRSPLREFWVCLKGTFCSISGVAVQTGSSQKFYSKNSPTMRVDHIEHVSCWVGFASTPTAWPIFAISPHSTQPL